MKSRGIFAVMAAMVVGLVSRCKDIFATSAHGSGGSNRVTGGRDAFLGVSAPRTRAMKRRHQL